MRLRLYLCLCLCALSFIVAAHALIAPFYPNLCTVLTPNNLEMKEGWRKRGQQTLVLRPSSDYLTIGRRFRLVEGRDEKKEE